VELVQCLSSRRLLTIARCVSSPPSQVADILERRNLTPERVVEVLTNTTLDFDRLNATLRSSTAFGNLTNLLGTFWPTILRRSPCSPTAHPRAMAFLPPPPSRSPRD
jgi:hypothetical protein